MRPDAIVLVLGAVSCGSGNYSARAFIKVLRAILKEFMSLYRRQRIKRRRSKEISRGIRSIRTTGTSIGKRGGTLGEYSGVVSIGKNSNTWIIWGV